MTRTRSSGSAARRASSRASATESADLRWRTPRPRRPRPRRSAGWARGEGGGQATTRRASSALQGLEHLAGVLAPQHADHQDPRARPRRTPRRPPRPRSGRPRRSWPRPGRPAARRPTTSRRPGRAHRGRRLGAPGRSSSGRAEEGLGGRPGRRGSCRPGGARAGPGTRPRSSAPGVRRSSSRPPTARSLRSHVVVATGPPQRLGLLGGEDRVAAPGRSRPAPGCAGLDDAGLLAGHVGPGRPEELDVVETDVGHHGDHAVGHVGGVPPAAEADLDHGHVDRPVGEPAEGGRGQ